jgi:transposase
MGGDYTCEGKGDLTYATHSAAPDLVGDATVARRRHERWPDEERERILAESFSSGEAIAQVARRNGVSLGLLHHWRRAARRSGAVEELRFVPVTVTPPPSAPREAGKLELAIRDVTVRIEGDVEAPRLRAVLAAIRG